MIDEVVIRYIKTPSRVSGFTTRSPDGCMNVYLNSALTFLARCPYYRQHDKQSICCEGVATGTCLRLSFAAAVSREEYMQRYCNARYAACRLCVMLDGKHED